MAYSPTRNQSKTTYAQMGLHPLGEMRYLPTESMTHCFLTCPRVKEVWAYYNQLISNVLNY